MVSVSVRQNRPELVGRNAHGTDSHPENSGLIKQVDGYYEPSHLRHRPGDTWIIDLARPRDPDDPGPFDSPGWRPDPRTGRHRRGELPDPVPPRMRETERGQEERSDGPPRRQDRFRRDGDAERSGEVGRQAEPHRFTRLQEQAWDRFVLKSAGLAAAHWVERGDLNRRHRRAVASILKAVRHMVGALKRAKGRPAAAGTPEAIDAGTCFEAAATAVAVDPVPARRRENTVVRADRPGVLVSQAIRGAQAARDACGGDVARRAGHRHMQPRSDRPRPSPVPYMRRWERAFDAQWAFGEVR
ncbi:hypothetical protein [Glycomyces paridis]|uniref:Uncharacterized protein n=1 Tax=Glycomyces paridis TaxID=2126555 RepID=A0A4V4HNN2_9ACTN|nr:hypothetical protein [Glycomyces paridis]THV26796.1 hypothetical protein E9998_17580 [Glycomyces paridis]